jgi:hypothetical protein
MRKLISLAAAVLLVVLGGIAGSARAPAPGTAAASAGGAPLAVASSNYAPVTGGGNQHELGDVDCAGALSSTDALFILRYVADLPTEASCLGVADINCSGGVDSVDALGVLRSVAGLSLPPAPPWCATLSRAIAVETSAQAAEGWRLSCPQWRHVLADAIGSFDNTSHHRAAVYCKEGQGVPTEKLVIYELQGDQLATLLTVNSSPETYEYHFDLAGFGSDPLPAFKDVNLDGLNELVVSAFSGGNCWECNRIRLFTAHDQQVHEIPVVLPVTGLLSGDANGDGTAAAPQVLRDVDGDGVLEVIAVDASWELHGFCHACSPAADFVLAWSGREYANASRELRFRGYFDARIAGVEAELAMGGNDGGERLLSSAISIALLYGNSGRAEQAWQRFYELTPGLLNPCWRDALPYYESDLELSVPKDGSVPQVGAQGSELPFCPPSGSPPPAGGGTSGRP